MNFEPVVIATAITLLALDTIAASSAAAAVQIDLFEDDSDAQMNLPGSFDLTGGTSSTQILNSDTAAIKAKNFFDIRTGQDVFFEAAANTDFGPARRDSREL